jgi:putative SOS response-associated peptidase YedK
MPAVLTRADEIDQWLTAPAPEALKLQRPLPDDALKIVARGSKKDGASADCHSACNIDPLSRGIGVQNWL